MQRLISCSIVKNLGFPEPGNEEAIESESGESDYEERSYASDDFEFMDSNYFSRQSAPLHRERPGVISRRMDHPITERFIVGG